MNFIFRTRAIITRGLYIFYHLFHCGLCSREVSVTVYVKRGNSSIFRSKIRGLYLRAVSNQEQVIMARVRYIYIYIFLHFKKRRGQAVSSFFKLQHKQKSKQRN